MDYWTTACVLLGALAVCDSLWPISIVRDDDGVEVIGHMRGVLLATLVTLGLIGCRSMLTRSTARYVVTAAPIDVGMSPRGLCVAVDPNDPKGVWWWEPGRLGCSSRSTGPSVFHADSAGVAGGPRSSRTDIHLRLQLITGPGDGPRFADVRLALHDGEIRSIRTGMHVSIERRHDLEIPESP
jgi:hypothetical protein